MPIRGTFDFDMASYMRKRAFSASTGLQRVNKNNSFMYILVNPEDNKDDLHIRLRAIHNLSKSSHPIGFVEGLDPVALGLTKGGVSNLWTGGPSGDAEWWFGPVDPDRQFPNGPKLGAGAHPGLTPIESPRLVPPGSSAGIVLTAIVNSDIALNARWVEGDPLD